MAAPDDEKYLLQGGQIDSLKNIDLRRFASRLPPLEDDACGGLLCASFDACDGLLCASLLASLFGMYFSVERENASNAGCGINCVGFGLDW
jgi:hypothetical protein